MIKTYPKYTAVSAVAGRDGAPGVEPFIYVRESAERLPVRSEAVWLVEIPGIPDSQRLVNEAGNFLRAPAVIPRETAQYQLGYSVRHSYGDGRPALLELVEAR